LKGYTNDIGGHGATLRAAVCSRAGRRLGVNIHPAANSHRGPCLDARSSKIAALVIPTDKDLMIARHTLRLIRGEADAPSRPAIRQASS
jgi:acetate kinase